MPAFSHMIPPSLGSFFKAPGPVGSIDSGVPASLEENTFSQIVPSSAPTAPRSEDLLPSGCHFNPFRWFSALSFGQASQVAENHSKRMGPVISFEGTQFHLQSLIFKNTETAVYRAKMLSDDGREIDVAVKILLGAKRKDNEAYGEIVANDPTTEDSADESSQSKSMEALSLSNWLADDDDYLQPLDPSSCEMSDVEATLEREAYALRLMHNSRHTPQVHMAKMVGSVGVLVTDYIDGVSLTNVMVALEKGDIDIPLDVCLTWLNDLIYTVHHGLYLTDDLQTGKSEGVVHGDMKGGNIRLTTKGHVVVFDFDGAWFPEKSDADSLNRYRKYTLEYVHPGWKKSSADGDKYAIGLLFYRMITGLKWLPRQSGESRFDYFTRCKDVLESPEKFKKTWEQNERILTEVLQSKGVSEEALSYIIHLQRYLLETSQPDADFWVDWIRIQGQFIRNIRLRLDTPQEEIDEFWSKFEQLYLCVNQSQRPLSEQQKDEAIALFDSFEAS